MPLDQFEPMGILFVFTEHSLVTPGLPMLRSN